MPEPRVTHELTGVEVFDVGTWNGREWTDADLDQMVANFAALGLDVPIKIGHSDDQELLASEGLPAAGWITRLYRKGSKLAADIEDVPDEVYRLLLAKAYRNVSAEVWEKVRYGERTYENVLAAVAFLGAELPAVTTLGDILERYGVRPHQLRPLAPAACFVARLGGDGARAIEPNTQSKPNHAGTSGETTKEEVMADLTRVTHTLGLAEGATEDQILAAIDTLRQPTTAQATTRDACEAEGGTWDSEAGTCTMPNRATLAARVRELETKLAERDAKDAVDAAVKARKLAPAQRDWAETYALKDPAGFKAYVKAAPEVFAAGEHGSDGDAPEPESEVVQFRKLVAERVKAGMSIDEAQRQVATEEPELFAAIRSRR